MLLSTCMVDILSTYYNMRRCYIWLVLLPYMIVVDVNTTKADVIAYCTILCYWQMLLPISGRCYGHFIM